MNGDYEWFLNADISEYAGKWVVVLNKRIVASGDNIKDLLAKVKKENPEAIPFVARVPRKMLMIV